MMLDMLLLEHLKYQRILYNIDESTVVLCHTVLHYVIRSDRSW